MSVMVLETEEIKNLFGMVKFYEEILANVVSNDVNNIYIMAKTLIMALIANRIAYAVQYSEPDGFHLDDIPFRKFDSQKYFTTKIIKPIECKKEDLSNLLRKLRYNLYTNNGEIFLEDKYLLNIENMIDYLNQ